MMLMLMLVTMMVMLVMLMMMVMMVMMLVLNGGQESRPSSGHSRSPEAAGVGVSKTDTNVIYHVVLQMLYIALEYTNVIYHILIHYNHRGVKNCYKCNLHIRLEVWGHIKPNF